MLISGTSFDYNISYTLSPLAVNAVVVVSLRSTANTAPVWPLRWQRYWHCLIFQIIAYEKTRHLFN